MQAFSVQSCRLKGLQLITARFSEDQRGYFCKGFEKNAFQAAGITMTVDESFETWSRHGVLRGLHFQHRVPQAKLVRPLSGSIYDVAVDIRRDSPTFGEWEGFVLSDENHRALYLPAGFAHGFLVLSDSALVSYQCESAFIPEEDTGLRWDDPDIGVQWPLEQVNAFIISPKDRCLPTLQGYIRQLEAQGGTP